MIVVIVGCCSNTWRYRYDLPPTVCAWYPGGSRPAPEWGPTARTHWAPFHVPVTAGAPRVHGPIAYFVVCPD